MRETQFKPYDSKACILLTTTIDPKGIVFMKRSDPKVRELDYINALKRWLESTPYPILFCENSAYDLHNIKKITDGYMNREIEFLSFDGQDFPRELGKGYGELLAIKYAIEHSNVIKHSQYVVKVNGRYFVENIKKITSMLSMDSDIYVMADLKRNLTFADSRVFAFKPSFISDYLSKFQEFINDSKGFYLEHALARGIFRAMSDGYTWTPLLSKPIISGYAGTGDIPYKSSKIRWLAIEAVHQTKNYLNRRC